MESRFCSSAVTVAAAAVNEAQPRPLKRPKKKTSPKCNSLQDSHEKSILQFSRHRGRRRRCENN